MQPNNDQSGTVNPFLKALLINAQNPGAQTSQALQTIMKNPQLASAYNDRANFYNSTNADAANGVVNGPSNPINGYAVNPSGPASSFAATVPANQAMTNNFLMGLLQQAQSGSNNANDNLANAGNTASTNQVDNRKQSATESLNGQTWNPTTNSVSFGGGAGNNNGFSPQNVQSLKDHGAADLFKNASSPAQQKEVYDAILQAGGISQYRAKNKQAQPPGLSDTVGETNETIKKIDYVQNQIAKSTSLRNYLNVEANKKLVKGEQQIDKNNGLSAADNQALAYLTSLNAINDKNAVGGRIGSQILQMIGPSSAGPTQSWQTNQTMLQNVKKMILDNMHSEYVTPYGYSTVMDLPNFDAGKIRVQAPNGQTGMIDYTEFRKEQAKGYKLL